MDILINKLSGTELTGLAALCLIGGNNGGSGGANYSTSPDGVNWIQGNMPSNQDWTVCMASQP